MSDAAMAAALLAIDPAGLGGAVLRGGAEPARDVWLNQLRHYMPESSPLRRIPAHIEDDRLIGGLDLAASLVAGRPVLLRGVLSEADGGLVVVAMAERLPEGVAARLAAVLDDRVVAVEREGLSRVLPARVGAVLLDEGMTPEEQAPAPLRERCAFWLEVAQMQGDAAVAADVVAARAHVADVSIGAEQIEALCAAAFALGVASLRAPIFAARAACAAAALAGRDTPSIDDLALAARLVLAPRATQAPTQPDLPSPPPDQATDPEQRPASAETAPTDMVIAAARAALPADLLAGLYADSAARGRARASGGGARVASPRRGRPVGVRIGAPRGGERLALVETLRAAAPWQRLRGAHGRVAVRREDFRVRRFAERRESTTVFVVDASGSAAFQRLAEAKGAVELLLADAYVSRTRVALVAFRNEAAEVLLPPTRSLARARKRLSELAGGGATPLAHGIEAALLVAKGEAAKGRTPRLLLLSDGRANIARDGAPGRARAEADALAAARGVRAAGFTAVHVDTAPRPSPAAERLARAMGALYAPLPYMDARAVSTLARAPR